MTVVPFELPRNTAATAVEPAFVTRIRLRAQRRVRSLRLWWAADKASPLDLAISPDAVDRILAGELAIDENDPASRTLATAIQEADRATAAHDVLARIRRVFALSDAETDLLTLVAAV